MIGSSVRLSIRVARCFALATALGLCAACGAIGVALAQTADHADAAQERSQSFQAVRGAVKEDVAGGPLLVSAYAAIWIVLLLYVIRLVRLQQRVQSDVERLERVLSQSTTSSGTAPALRGGASVR